MFTKNKYPIWWVIAVAAMAVVLMIAINQPVVELEASDWSFGEMKDLGLINLLETTLNTSIKKIEISLNDLKKKRHDMWLKNNFICDITGEFLRTEIENPLWRAINDPIKDPLKGDSAKDLFKLAQDIKSGKKQLNDNTRKRLVKITLDVKFDLDIARNGMAEALKRIERSIKTRSNALASYVEELNNSNIDSYRQEVLQKRIVGFKSQLSELKTEEKELQIFSGLLDVLLGILEIFVNGIQK